ncbi:MAG: acyl--CoA ligase, partial [Sinobacterium sp.]|nr:acyl--CoA ligase [Sinobacterium sp.]
MNAIVQKIQESTAQLTAPEAPWSVTNTTIDGIDYKHYPNAPKTLAELLDHGRSHDADAEFIIYEGERISFGEYFNRADAIASQLQTQFNVQKGDRIAIAMRNYPEWMMAFAGIIYAGGVPVPLNSWGQAGELKYGLNDSGANLAFVDQQRFNYIKDDLAELNIQAIVARPSEAISA